MEKIRLIEKIKDAIVNPLMALLIGLALVWFFFGVYEFVMGAESEAKREQGKQHMIWGIVGLVIMITVFGIMKVICSTLGGEC